MPKPATASGWIDCTRPLHGGMIDWPGDPPFQLRTIHTITTPGTCKLSEVTMSTHAGTHIDAPQHFVPDGTTIDALSLDALCGPATVIEVKEARPVQVADVRDADIGNGARVLFKTANQALWHNSRFDPAYHALEADLAIWLVEHNVRLVGIDYLSVDSYDDARSRAHCTLLGAGVIVIESLDLSQVQPGRYEMVALPLRIVGGEASPARVIVRPLA
ncbi:MAG: cyclase family protein [Phycisphaerae bacterium]|nr:cyclase family protein [Phycisphaerae bacterium]